MLLLDSNILIYSVQPAYTELREWIKQQDIAASEVSLVEVLGYPQLTDEDEQDLTELFGVATLLPVSRAIINRATSLRQQRKMSLGDALIAATAITHELTLVTRNTSDFAWITDLPLINPLQENDKT